MPINPPPVRGNLKTYPDPRIEDIVFKQEAVVLFGSGLPDYGAPHPQPALWPDHKFCYAEVADPEKNLYDLWYCADRESQEEYNAELTLPYFNNPNFPRFQRTYILPRGDGPGQAFEKVTPGTPDPVYPDALLIATSVVNIDPPIGSLYQKVIRIYSQIPGGPGDPDGGGGGGDPSGESQKQDGYSWIRPIQTEDWVRLTWQITLPTEVAANNLTDDYTQCIIPGFENLVLVDEVVQDSPDAPISVTVIRTYEGRVAGPSGDPSPVFKKQVREIPGALPPAKFCTVMTTVDDGTLVINPNAYNVGTVTAPSGTLARVEVEPNGGKLRGQANTEYASFTTTPLTGRQWDNNLNTFVSYQIEVMTPVNAAAYAAAAPAGTEVTIQPFSPFWSIVTTEAPTQGTIGGAFPPTVKYYVTHPYTWPAVLQDLQYGSIGLRPAPGVAPTDGATFFYDYTLKPAWSGLCKAEIQIAFYATNPLSAATDIPTQQLAPNDLTISWPGVARMEIPSCLHEEMVFSGSTGSDNPRYAYVAYSKTWTASQLYTGGSGSDQIDWPDSLIIGYDVKPYRNGFVVTQLTVFKPF